MPLNNHNLLIMPLNFEFLNNSSNYYFPTLVNVYWISILGYMLATWLAEKRNVPVIAANGLRVFSLVIGGLTMTAIFSSHAIALGHWALRVAFLSASCAFALWYFHRFDVRCILASLVFMPLILFIAYCHGFYAIVTQVPALAWLICINSIALLLAHFLSAAYGVFDLWHEQLLRFKFYAAQIHIYSKNPSFASLNLASGLSFSILNFIGLTQTWSSGWSILMLCFLAFSIFYQSIMAIGLISLCNKEKITVRYAYGFVIQSYLNLWVTLKKVVHQTQLNLLPMVTLNQFSMMLFLFLIQSPLSYCACVDGDGSLGNFNSSGENPAQKEKAPGSSSELSRALANFPAISEPGSSQVFSTNEMEELQGLLSSTQSGDASAVAEGAAGAKAVKTLGPYARAAAQGAKTEAADFAARCYDKTKHTAATAVGTAVVGATVVTGYEFYKQGSLAVGQEPYTYKDLQSVFNVEPAAAEEDQKSKQEPTSAEPHCPKSKSNK